MTTETPEVTDEQIETLRTEAGQAATVDHDQIALCVTALGGTLSRSEFAAVSSRMAGRIIGMTTEQARAECARVIAHAAAQD